MTTIVTVFGKFGYNRLPMGVCSLGDIFEGKVYELISDTEAVKKCVDDTLILSNYFFKKHVDQLKIIFGRLRASGLKVDAHKCISGLKEIPYLGYVKTREGIKYDPKKLQGIADLGRPATTTEARALIGMFQYYRNMWPRWSHVLAPFTEAASGPKDKKCGMTL